MRRSTLVEPNNEVYKNIGHGNREREAIDFRRCAFGKEVANVKSTHSYKSA